MRWLAMTSTPRSLITRVLLPCIALASSACIKTSSHEDTRSNKQPDVGDMSAPAASVVGISILLDGEEVGSTHTVARGSTRTLTFRLIDEDGELFETLPTALEIEVADVYVDGERENQPLDRAAFLALLQGDKLTFEEFGRVKLIARTQDTAASVFIDIIDDAPMVDDFEPLTLLREGDVIDLYETLTVEDNGFSLPIARECNAEVELSASGAIELDNGPSRVTLTATRTGYGELVLDCDALGEYGAPTSRTYRFHVEPATQLSAGEEHTCGLLRDNLSAGGESVANVYCWGLNDRGQVAKLGGQDRLSPEVVLRDALDVATGPKHSCAITRDDVRKGKLECWGDNTLGQSNPQMTTSSTLKLPSKLEYEYASFVKTCAGAQFSCGLTDSGRLLCWGLNSSGALGPDVELGAITRGPVEVARGEKFYEVGCGRAHICATSFDGQTVCWGDNTNKQLGAIDAPTTSTSPIPTTIAGNTFDFETLELHKDTSCGVLKDGSLLCWGDNASRNLTSQHIDAALPEPTPITLPPPRGSTSAAIDSVALGDKHACAITRDGRLFCWGQNTWGQVGAGDFEPRYEDPELVVSPTSDPRSVSVGAMHTCTTLRAQSQGEQDRLSCWGRSDNGKLGDGSSHIIGPSAAPTISTYTTDVSLPALPRVPHARALVSGSHHNCVFADPSEDTTFFEHLYCWGSDALGQRGRLLDLADASKGETSTHDELPPTRRSVGGLDLVQMSAGDSHTCALNTSLPVPPIPPDGCGDEVMEQGSGYSTIHCWGLNSHLQAGPPSLAGTASPLTTISPGPTSCVEDFANTLPARLGSIHSCGFYLPAQASTPGFDQEPKGPAFCWGNGSRGQQGVGKELFSESSFGPSIPVITGSEFSGMTSYGSLNYAWRNTFSSGFGKLYAWGHDPRGLVKDWGDTPASERIIWTAERISEWNKSDGESLREQAKSIEHLAPGLDHICAVTNRQTNYVVCWGSNEHGQLGLPDAGYARADEYRVVRAGGQDLTGAVQLVSGEAHTCALLSDNRLYCWGRNDRGQVGAVSNGSVAPNAHVVREPHLIRAFADANLEVLEITAGKEHTCARARPLGAASEDDDLITIHCWGANDLGQSSWPVEAAVSRCQDRASAAPRWSREATPCEVWPR